MAMATARSQYVAIESLDSIRFHDVQSDMRWIPLLLVLAFACPSSSDEGSEESSGTEEEIRIESDDESDHGETASGSENDGLVVGDDPCESDADCVKATCCHATACVAAANAPDCSDAMCTADCQFGTTDCGGGCLCHEGRCAARLSEEPEIAAPQ